MTSTVNSGVTSAAFILRLYGIACVGAGSFGLWLALTMEPGTHGVVDWSRLWPEATLSVLLGITVFLLLRWFVLAFSLVCAGVSICYIGFTLMAVSFPAGWFNLLFATLLIIPAFLTSYAWHSLR